MIDVERLKNWIVAFSLPLVVTLFYITAIEHFGYTPDDTYIYLQYAKNLIRGDGIAFTAGEPTYGITSPLWLFIISAGGKLGVDLFLAAKVIDLLLASLALVIFYFVSFEVIRDVAVAICATVAFSVNAWFLRWAGSGMETSLALILVLGSMLYCLRNEYGPAIFFAGLAVLVRPETIVLPFFIGLDLFLNSYNKHRALRTAIVLGIVYLAILVPWLIVAGTTFGTIIPNTALAKTVMRFDIGSILSSLGHLGKVVGVTDGLAALTIVLCGLYLLPLYSRSRGITTREVQDARFFLFRQSVLGIGWIVALPLVYLLMDVNIVSRYLLLMTPLLTIFAFSFLHKAIDNSPLRRRVYTAVFILTAFILTQNQIMYRVYVRPGMQLFEDGMGTCLVPIAKWLKENTEPDAKILAADVGVLGFFSDRKVYDAAGLVSPEFLPLLRSGNPADSIIAKRLFTGISPVDYVVARSGQLAKPMAADSMKLLFSKPFYGLSISDPKLTYYSVYKIERPHSAELP